MNEDKLKKMNEVQADTIKAKIPSENLKGLEKIKWELAQFRAEKLETLDDSGKKRKTLQPLEIALKLFELMRVVKLERDNGQLAMYNPDKGIYEVSESFFHKMIYVLEPTLSKQRSKEVIFKLETLAEVKKTNETPYLIPVKNGIFNKKTQKLEPFSPDYIFTSTIGTAYNAEAKPSQIDGWNIDEWFADMMDGDKERVKLLWQIISASINGNYSYRKGVWLLGNGNDGKGTFQSLIMNLVGLDNVCTLKAEQFAERFALAGIPGKTVIIGDESQIGFLDNAGNYFSAITADLLQIEGKGEKAYPYVPRKLIIQSTNNMPTFRNKSNGTYRRLLIVPFNKSYSGSGDNWKIKDDCIKRKDVLEYVLKRALELNFDKFIEPKASLAQLIKFREENDSALAFVEFFLPQLSSKAVPVAFISGAYLKWALDMGIKPFSKRQFENKLPDHIKGKWIKKDVKLKGKFYPSTDIPKAQEFGFYYSFSDEQMTKRLERL